MSNSNTNYNSMTKVTAEDLVIEGNKPSNIQTTSINENQNPGQTQSKTSTSNNSNRVKPKSIGHYILGTFS